MSRIIVVLALVALAWRPDAAHACAGCSNPNLPGGRTGILFLRPGQVAATLHMTGTTMEIIHSEHCPEIGPICAERDEPPQLHDQDFQVGEIRPVAEVGITHWLSASLELPLRITRTRIVFRRLDGTAFTPDYENIHHRNETLTGLADPWLSGRAAWRLGEWSFAGRAGVTLPLGRTEPDPFALGRDGMPHQHIQYGTGTFNPLLGLELSRRLGIVQLSSYAQAFLSLYENKHDYRAGNRYTVGASADVGIGRRLRLGLGTDLLNEQPERWNGMIQQDGNVGRTDLLAGGTVAVSFGRVTGFLSVKMPVWQKFIERGHTHEDQRGQLTYPAIVNIGVQTLFGGAG